MRRHYAKSITLWFSFLIIQCSSYSEFPKKLQRHGEFQMLSLITSFPFATPDYFQITTILNFLDLGVLYKDSVSLSYQVSLAAPLSLRRSEELAILILITSSSVC